MPREGFESIALRTRCSYLDRPIVRQSTQSPRGPQSAKRLSLSGAALHAGDVAICVRGGSNIWFQRRHPKQFTGLVNRLNEFFFCRSHFRTDFGVGLSELVTAVEDLPFAIG